MDARRRPRRRLRGAARAASRRRGAVRLARLDAPELHPLHQRHDRPAEGRAARHRRLRGGAGREHEAHLLRQRRRDLLLDQRHRLGGRPQLHRLRAADRRHGDDHVRGPADPARRRHLVEPGREVQGHRDVQRADRDPRAEEAGPEVPAQARPVVAARAVPGRRAARRADRALDRRRRSASRSSTTTGRPKAAGRSSPSPTASSSMPSKFGSPGVPMYGYDVQAGRRGDRRATSTTPNEKGVVVIDGPTPPGFMQTVWRDDARFVETYWKSIPGGASTAPSTGASATPTATSSSSAAPTT